MLVGVPKEIKNNEYRVGLTPSSTHELVQHGHRVILEKGAGDGSGLNDEEYARAGAELVSTPEEIFHRAEMIVKVKEPQPNERKLLRDNQILYTYLHLAPDPAQTDDLIASGAVCIAYETVTSASGGLPLLTPMSEIAGRLAPQVGAHALEKSSGGRGILLGGVPGVPSGEVLVIGAGVAGTQAATISLGMGANVTVVDRDLETLRRLSARFGERVHLIHSTRSAIAELVQRADLVIGTVLIPGASAPKLITRDMLKTMKPGSVIVDVAIDQGGCCETSHATTHSDPTYVVDDVIHYCVANMPGAVARTSTLALNNATLPFALALADKGWRQAVIDDIHLRHGVNVCAGQVVCKPVADAQNRAYSSVEALL
ncbi:alanine dehydrogenase [Methylovirgula sp. 4M-Z18]|uniref:alanine dehydrogenase n=1 Tax=Methylovirgula sp. 4M-Z18 TaxID=2293567 RepID=UPI000E2F6C6B|nr:alanine dehydrogenase [Methylovirgula sp. 4M-Z18]RFB79870.1 alanine dehydrogenase [Methylovirgula sp. 4M-Z18]